MMSFFIAPRESPDEPRRLRTLWRFLIFGLGYLFVQMLLAVGFAVVWIAWLFITGETDLLTNPSATSARISGSELTLQAILSTPLAGLTLGLCLLCRRYLDRRPALSMGLVRPARGLTTGVFSGFLFGVAPIALASFALCLTGGFRFEGFAVPMQALYMAPAFVFLAFHEEIIFRGYLLQNLFDIDRQVSGIVATAVLFCLMHAFNPGAWGSPVVAVNLFGAGVLLALAYQLSGNIWFPTALHFGWNLAQGVIFSIPVSGMSLEGFVKLERNKAYSELLTGGGFGLEGSVVITALELLMILILIRAIQRRRDAEAGEADQSDDAPPAISD